MGDSPANSKRSSDDVLAATIADAITKASLVSQQKAIRLRDGLAKGTLTAADWKLLAELAVSDKGRDSL
jgi:hypothetical protein